MATAVGKHPEIKLDREEFRGNINNIVAGRYSYARQTNPDDSFLQLKETDGRVKVMIGKEEIAEVDPAEFKALNPLLQKDKTLEDII